MFYIIEMLVNKIRDILNKGTKEVYYVNGSENLPAPLTKERG